MCNPNTSAASRRRSLLSQAVVEASKDHVNNSKSNRSFDPAMWANRNSNGAMMGIKQMQQQQQPYFNGSVSSSVFTSSTSWNASSLSSLAQHASFDPSLLFPTPLAPNAIESKTSNSGSSAKPKRKRKPQKPGKTAKQNDRHFVIHNYHDHGHDTEQETLQFLEEKKAQEELLQQEDTSTEHNKRKGGVAISFPTKLHAILEQVDADGFSHVISWQPHGRCFAIHNPQQFTEYIMPQYFRQSKLTSFQRQLNLYGFQRLTRGPDAGGTFVLYDV
jgi:hypothetical protein